MKIHLLVSIIFFTFPLIAQTSYIHVESVGEWQMKEQLSPEYRFNSVGVYLVNEQQLNGLFDPGNMSKEERKKAGIRSFDAVESLFFQLDMPNPKNEEDIISFPLYSFDVKPTTSFKSPRTQGKIIDRITDEELNGRGLDALARIEMVSKNELLEMAYKISSNINKLLGNRLYENLDVWKVMEKAQHFFESRYRGEMVAEFSVPILAEREEYEYIIESASLYQIKWNFQEKIDSYKKNIWSDLRHTAVISEEDLLDRPTRLSKLQKHPFLVVVRYKSAYAIPIKQQLNVAFTKEYLEARRYNLHEFKNESVQYRLENTFTQLLQKALDIQQNVDTYLASKRNGENDPSLLLTLPQGYFDILLQYHQSLPVLANESTYFKETYETTYFKFFKKLEHLLMQDPQVHAICQSSKMVHEWESKQEDSLSINEAYGLLQSFSPYLELARATETVTGNLPFQVKETVLRIEKILFAKLLAKAPYTQQNKLAYFQQLGQQYPLCTYCEVEGKEQIKVLENRVEKELQAAFLSLQNQQLKYGRCFAQLQEKAKLELQKQFSNSSSDQQLYQAFKDKIKVLEEDAAAFLTIAKVSIVDLPIEEVAPTYKKYDQLLIHYQQQVCQLVQGGILDKKEVQCFDRVCKMTVP